MKTVTVDKAWFHYLSENCIGSTGYGGNIAGMRKLWWGKNALVVRCCGYLFNVSVGVYDKVTGGVRHDL